SQRHPVEHRVHLHYAGCRGSVGRNHCLADRAQHILLWRITACVETLLRAGFYPTVGHSDGYGIEGSIRQMDSSFTRQHHYSHGGSGRLHERFHSRGGSGLRSKATAWVSFDLSVKGTVMVM